MSEQISCVQCVYYEELEHYSKCHGDKIGADHPEARDSYGSFPCKKDGVPIYTKEKECKH